MRRLARTGRFEPRWPAAITILTVLCLLAVLFACFGECPRNRFISTPDGEPGLNYLCAGYKQFFKHIDAPMRTMASLIRQGRYADEIMQMAPRQTQRTEAGT